MNRIRDYIQTVKKGIGSWWGEMSTTSSEQLMLDDAVQSFDALVKLTERALERLSDEGDSADDLRAELQELTK